MFVFMRNRNYYLPARNRPLTNEDYAWWAEHREEIRAKLDSSDASVTNSRTPTAHATSHKTGGSDALHLDELAAPSGSVALGSQKITGLANGTASTDAAAYGQLAWPRRISISCATSPPNTYTTWTPTFSAVFYGGYSAGATSSGGESWTYYVLLEAGTYSFRLVRRNTSASGKILPTLGGTALTDVDGYAGSNTGDQASTQTGITVAASGLIALVFTNPNKNASSSGYGWTIQGFDLWRTGA